jgi:hypothetical protein
MDPVRCIGWCMELCFATTFFRYKLSSVALSCLIKFGRSGGFHVTYVEINWNWSGQGRSVWIKTTFLSSRVTYYLPILRYMQLVTRDYLPKRQVQLHLTRAKPYLNCISLSSMGPMYKICINWHLEIRPFTKNVDDRPCYRELVLPSEHLSSCVFSDKRLYPASW